MKIAYIGIRKYVFRHSSLGRALDLLAGERERGREREREGGEREEREKRRA
jgi:hypothetical protein